MAPSSSSLTFSAALSKLLHSYVFSLVTEFSSTVSSFSYLLSLLNFSCIVLLSSVSISRTTVLNFLPPGKSLLSSSFRSFSKVLFCSVIWNIFLCLFIFLDCVHIYALDKTPTPLNLEGVSSCRR